MVDVPAQLQELEDVAALSFQRDPTKIVRTEFPKIANRALVKRESHDASVKKFTAELNLISDEIEAMVLQASFSLKAQLEKADGDVGAIFAEMNRDELLVTKEAAYLGESWDGIDGFLQARHASIRAFGATLEQLERDRAGRELRTLVDRLLKIAYKSPGEIERLVEAEAFELNTVIIANRRSHAELLAMLERKDVGVGLVAIESWRRRQEAWRRLRHDRAVAEFQAELDGATFTNPPERGDLFERIKARQVDVDARRSAILDGVKAMKCPTLESGEVTASKALFKEIYEAEDEAIARHEAELETLREAKRVEAEQRREALSAELHRYGALEDEPDLESHARAIEAVTHDANLEALFRSAGGLKLELRELVAELRHPDLIYERALGEAQRRLEVLLCGSGLQAVLEKQGKSQQQKSIQDTLERLRKAARAEVVPLLPLLEQQLTELVAVAGLDELLVEQLRQGAEDLRTITKDLDYRSGTRGSKASGATGRSKGSNKSGKSPSRSGASTARSGASRGGLSSAGTGAGGLDGPEVNMLEVRSIQKRVAMHVHACELDPSFLEDLRETLGALRKKRTCNEKIDEVVSAECEAIIALRVEEQKALAHHIVVYLEHQASDVYETACRVCDFYVKVAKAIEENHQKEHDMDESMLDELFDLKEALREKDADLEARVSASSDRLRHAADDGELEAAFASVLDLLNQIEDKYRAYHGEATAKSLTHPTHARAEQDRFEGMLCAMLGLAARSDRASVARRASAKAQAKGRKGDVYAVSEGRSYDVKLPLPKLPAAGDEAAGDGDAGGLWAPGFAPMPEEELALLEGKKREAYLDARDAAFRVLSPEQVEDLPADEREAYEALAPVIDARRTERAAEKKALAERRARERAEMTEAPVDARRAEYTEELEERLRTHWPRKGRSEVSFRQPREGELIMHRQRKERHMRIIQQRDRLQTADCLAALADAEAKVAAFSTSLAALEASLGSMGSLAGLQGVESKCKKLASTFGVECAKELQALEHYTVTEPHKLVQLNEVMLKATRLFSDGGDYSEKEAEELTEKLDSLRAGIEQSVAARAEKLAALQDLQREALTGLVGFQREAEACLQELSLREGLGMKYGAPRRNAQEKLRTEQTRDEADAAHLDALLEALERACRDVRDASQGRRRRTDARPRRPEPRHFGYFGRDPQARVPPRDVPQLFAEAGVDRRGAPDHGAGDDEGEAPHGPEHAELLGGRDAREGTIAAVVRDVEARCREETHELYVREGKEDRLGPSGVPDSLQAWLSESEKKVLGEGGYREKAARRLRVQVQRLERLVAKAPVPPDPDVLGAPAAVVADAAARTRREAVARREDTEAAFQRKLRLWVDARDAHRGALRPQLGRPDAAEDLRRLCADESARRDEVLAAIDAVQTRVVDEQSAMARVFVRRLFACCRRTMAILDNLIMVDDLGWLPGDEFLEKKRKSLKRLKKAHRLSQLSDDVQPEVLDETGLKFGDGRGRARGATGRASTCRPWPPSCPRRRPTTRPRRAPASGDGDEPLEDTWAALTEAMSHTQTAAVTTAHRVFVKARDHSFADYLDYDKSNMANVLQHYGAIKGEEIGWQGKWEKLVKGLVVESD
ncbi:DUF4455-containing protein [Aureococcus anophagefferens]|nr:DUF4455-containing protein [Aureococcus anophagefferens]